MAHLTIARRGKVISPTGFAGYTHCYNPYVGCQHGCAYCYVQFFIRDNEHKWGDWVRIRRHAPERLEQEVAKLGPAKLVIGTMTDPYQPAEINEMLTKRSLRILANTQLNKVGIFTRSTMVLRDLEIIKMLPKGRVHLTITPFDPELLKALEPLTAKTKARFITAKRIKAANIRLHVNVAPVIPIISDNMLEDIIGQLAELEVDEFFVDPMQPYKESYARVTEALQDRPEWPQIDHIMSDRVRYKAWKSDLNERLIQLWTTLREKSPNTMAIACDHENKLKMDMNTRVVMDWNTYDEYEDT